MEDPKRDPFDLTGRVALVTGAASGLGLAISIGLSERGAAVAAADINEVGLRQAVASLRVSGRAIGVRVDVTDPASIEAMFDRAAQELGPVDILVNCAFVPSPKVASEDTPLDAWERVLRVDLTGYFLCTQAAGKRMIASGRGGSIVNLSSITGSSGIGRELLGYGVAKSGINQLTRELAIEWARYKIRVNAILPCQILTPALRAFMDDPANDGQGLLRTFLHGIPLGRLGNPEDVVGPVAFLASDAAAMVTGVLLPVDGGNLAMNAGGTLRE